MKIREKGAEREEWKRREAHAYTIGERGRVAVGESCVSVPCGDMMFVMRVCVLWRWRRAMTENPKKHEDELCTSPGGARGASCESREQK